jgi:AAA-like domain/NB-ARC domain/TIR domain
VHLVSLERQGKITAWHDRAIEAGQEWAYEVKTHLESAHIILLLISPDFLASEHCYDQEMQRAMERHEAKTAIVLPIILRPVYQIGASFSKLEVLPREGKAVTRWNDQDEAFVNVIEGIDKVIQSLSHSLSQTSSNNRLKTCQPHHNLPQPDYGKFIGREEEKAKIIEKLRPYPDSVHSVITIDGIGGIGKSALVLEVSLSFLRNYESLSPEKRFEAIIWTSAKRTLLKVGKGIVDSKQAFQTLDDIYQTLAVVLQVENLLQLQKEERKEIICRELTQKRTLLIIDNLETVDDTAVMEFLQDSLPAPTKAIVTTRHRIDVAFPIRLRGMSWNDAELLIQQECEKKAVKLSEENQHNLYNRTGGVPLAIVWSIGQVGFGYPINMVLKKLGNHSGDLTKFCFQDAVDRIRGKIGYKLLLSLALCKGDSSREELGYISDLEDDEWSRDDGLVELEKLSLVNKESDRFSLLPLTKEYVNHELENNAEFVERAIIRLITYQSSRDLILSREYFEKYKDRLSNSAKIEALSTIGYGAQEVPRGQVPSDSPFYVERPPMELACYQEIMRPGALIRINGPRQVGKSSLLSRIVQYASQQNYKTVSLDFQRFDVNLFSDLRKLLKQLCFSITENLKLPNRVDESWDEVFGDKNNFTIYMQEYVLPECKVPLVLALDEVDRVFQYPNIADEFLSLIRVLHEQAKISPFWQNLRLVIVNSEVYNPLDMNASPLNVGLPVSPRNFSTFQVLDLSKRHGLSLSDEQVESLMKMFGGLPYLIRAALHEIAQGQITLKEFLQVAPTEQGIYEDHLRRHLLNLEENPELLLAMKQLVSTEEPIRLSSMMDFKLSRMGLVNFIGSKTIPSCELYRVYFRERLA